MQRQPIDTSNSRRAWTNHLRAASNSEATSARCWQPVDRITATRSVRRPCHPGSLLGPGLGSANGLGRSLFGVGRLESGFGNRRGHVRGGSGGSGGHPETDVDSGGRGQWGRVGLRRSHSDLGRVRPSKRRTSDGLVRLLDRSGMRDTEDLQGFTHEQKLSPVGTSSFKVSEAFDEENETTVVLTPRAEVNGAAGSSTSNQNGCREERRERLVGIKLGKTKASETSHTWFEAQVGRRQKGLHLDGG
ncbi:hypothetical protein DFP72DRAFT_925939 [Ephemerocybe angulata]|uniref:Uncharacterized protein n=1 Tax=Ephemerocybe angulata TaxID=980116 RepID=A0A8H6LY92_9AGAR|nr:hypothetical protein DFP72DRAFT_925939 [Tulosesus angulatus]